MMFNIEEVIDDKKYLAHIKGGKIETLKEHSDLVFDYYLLLKKKNGIKMSVKKIVDRIGESKRLDLKDNHYRKIEELFDAAIYYHDLGKINKMFQRDKMGQSHIESVRGAKSQHSLLSSYMYIELFYDYIKDEDEDIEYFLRYVLYLFSYVISRHHTYLQDMYKDRYKKDLEEMIDLKEEVKECYFEGMKGMKDGWGVNNVEELIEAYEEEKEEYYPRKEIWLMMKLLYSSMVTSDFMATYEFMSGEKPVVDDWEDKKDELKDIEDKEIYKDIRKFKETGEGLEEGSINYLRTSMLLEAEKGLEKNLDKSIYYLEAPTGSGKTITSIMLAKKMLEEREDIKKWMYIFPFNTLMDQTKGVLEGFKNNEFKVINNITPLVSKEDRSEEEREDEISFGEVLLQRQTMQYRSVMTSHVNLFNRIFGNGRESNLSFMNLANSVIIIDEIQSFDNKLWIEMAEFLHLIGDVMNIKFIVMSATLPVFSKYIGEEDNMVSLIEDRDKYFKSNIFKERVEINTEWLDESIGEEEVIKRVEEVVKGDKDKKYLFMVNTKKKARELFLYFRESFEGDIDVLELSGSDNRYYREKMIRDIKEEGKPVFVVATQVIEAGVDIDVDVGFKDISKLDAEEQFLGRINRSCKREGKAYFFDIGTGKIVYRNDVRMNKTIKEEESINILRNKEFGHFYEGVMSRIIEKKKEDRSKGVDGLDILIDRLDFNSISKYMELINVNNWDVFINYILEKEDGKVIRGEDVWEEYKDVLSNKDMGYAEKQVRLSELKGEMDYFIFSINKFFGVEEFPFDYRERVGDLYYREDGEELMENFEGIMKFNKDNLEEDVFL